MPHAWLSNKLLTPARRAPAPATTPGALLVIGRTARYEQRNVVPVQQDLVQVGRLLTLGRDLLCWGYAGAQASERVGPKRGFADP